MKRKEILVLLLLGTWLISSCGVGQHNSESYELTSDSTEENRTDKYSGHLETVMEEVLMELEEIDKCKISIEYDGDNIVSMNAEIKKSDSWVESTEGEVYDYLLKATGLSKEQVSIDY